MLQEDKPMTEMESLAIITGMINRAKNRLGDNGTLYLLWGWLILICCTVQFIINNFFTWPYSFTIWYSTWILVIYQIYYLRKRKKLQGVSTYTDDIAKYVWLTMVICAVLLMIIIIKFRYFLAIYPTLLVVYGIPTFLSGVILKSKPLRAGGLICWGLSIVAVFTPFQYQLLLIAAAVIAAWIIPGYSLRAKFKKEN